MPLDTSDVSKDDIVFSFDLDGTVIDSIVTGREKFYTAAKERGHVFTDDKAELLGRIWGKPVPELFDTVFAEVEQDVRDQMVGIFYGIKEVDRIPIINGAPEAIHHVFNRTAGITLATQRELATTEQLLKRFDIYDLFVHIACYGTVKVKKPDPAFLDCTRAKLDSRGIVPKHWYHVGDHEDDFLLARNANLTGAVMVKTGPLQYLAADDTTYPQENLLDSVADLPVWFDRKFLLAA